MHVIQTIHVVLGEGQPGLLRLVLEAQGFEVVGHARDDDELLRVLDVTTPTVVVLDAGISAVAASAVDVRTGGAPIVVVWPRDVVTSLAVERVDPSNVILELGNAVRRAAERRPYEEPIRIPEAAPPVDAIDVPLGPIAAPPGRRGARRPVAVAIAAWILSLTALGAIGVALPRVIERFDRGPGERTAEPDREDRGGVVDREAEGTRHPVPDDPGTPPTCSPDRNADPEPGEGRGCGKGHAKGSTAGADRPGPTKPAKGRPDDPGKANSKGSGKSEKTNGDAGEDGGDPTGSTGDSDDGDPGQGGERGRGSSDDAGAGGGPADQPSGQEHGKNES